MAATKKHMQRKQPPPTLAEISRDLAETARLLSGAVETLAGLVPKVDRLIARVEAIDRSQTRHETDVLAHKASRAR